MDNIVIFGAKSKALCVCCAIRKLYRNINIIGFIVSNKTGNPDMLAGLPVFEIDSIKDKSVHVLIATPEDIQDSICKILYEKGFINYTRIDSIAENGLVEQYYKEIGLFPSVKSLAMTKSCTYKNKCNEMKGADNDGIQIKIASVAFHKDKPIRNKIVLPPWLYKIQVGAALTDKRVADICDNVGNNISYKNANYCELTALYWMWKNWAINESDLPVKQLSYYGLYHYRRILNLSNEDITMIAHNDIDAILPFPMMSEPNIKEHHTRFLDESDWCAMLSALKELQPEYYKAYETIFCGQYMYNYNILIAKSSIFKEYCEWLFPILERTEELSVPRGRDRSDRYIGYLGENLLTLFFMYNKDKYKILHTGVIMLT